MRSAPMLFDKPSFEALEKYLNENKTEEFLLTGADLAVLIFLTRSETYATINRNTSLAKIVASHAEQETKDLLSRLTGQGPRDTEQKQ